MTKGLESAAGEATTTMSSSAIPNVSKIFGDRAEKVIAEIPRALEPDNVEGIHDLRVAVRRFRTAMTDLGTLADKKAIKKADKKVKLIAKEAGAIRDLDVGIEMLEKLRDDAPDASFSDGLEQMIAERRDNRAAEFAKLTHLLDADHIDSVAAAVREAAVMDPEGSDAADVSAIENDVIAGRSRDLRDLAPHLYDPSDHTGHHELRIAAKRLRYSLELLDTDSGSGDASPAKRVAEMQQYLGDVHDCDVWLEELTRRIKKARKRGDEAGPEFLTSEWLLGLFARRRAKYYQQALELWSEWRRSGFLEGLITDGDLG